MQEVIENRNIVKLNGICYRVFLRKGHNIYVYLREVNGKYIMSDENERLLVDINTLILASEDEVLAFENEEKEYLREPLGLFSIVKYENILYQIIHYYGTTARLTNVDNQLLVNEEGNCVNVDISFLSLATIEEEIWFRNESIKNSLIEGRSYYEVCTVRSSEESKVIKFMVKEITYKGVWYTTWKDLYHDFIYVVEESNRVDFRRTPNDLYKDKEIYLTESEALLRAKAKTLQSKEKYAKEMFNSFYELLDEFDELNLAQGDELPFTILKLNGDLIFKDNINEKHNSIYKPIK